MKAFSPVRSVRKSGLSEHNLGISRSKTPVDDPMSLLYNMNDCYSKLKELVPSIPQNKKVSKMEILQHVIDYILDLQIALDSHPSIVSLHHQRPGQNPSSRTPLTTLNTDISILSLQVTAGPSAPGAPPTSSVGLQLEMSLLTAERGGRGGDGTGRDDPALQPPCGGGERPGIPDGSVPLPPVPGPSPHTCAVFSSQASEFPSELMSSDSKALCG